MQVVDKFYTNGSENNCTQVDLHLKRYYLPIMYSILFAVDLVGNTISIIIYVAKMRPWKSNCIITLNLALNDLLYALSTPFVIHYHANGDNWTTGNFMCRIVRFAFHLNLYGSILFLACLSMFRYVAVVQPLKLAKLQQRRWGIAASLLVWVVSFSEIAPMLSLVTLVEEANHTYCLDFASIDPEVAWWYGWLLTTLGYMVPLLVVFICHLRIAQTLSQGLSAHLPSRMRVRRLTVLILVVFVICFMPYHILRLLRVDSRRRQVSCWTWRWIHAAYILSWPLAGLNTFFDLALYTLAGDRFQRALFELFQRDCCLTKPKPRMDMTVVNTQATFSS